MSKDLAGAALSYRMIRPISGCRTRPPRSSRDGRG